MLTLEKRPTSPARLASIALGAVFAAVVGILFIAPMIAGYQAAVLSPGDSVRHAKYPGTVEAINDRGEATVRTFDGEAVKVPASELVER
jgi:multidrug efflux pump subunit AcrA (membrane-fusion protein)